MIKLDQYQYYKQCPCKLYSYDITTYTEKYPLLALKITVCSQN